MTRRLPEWAISGWETPIAFVAFGGVDYLFRWVLSPASHRLGAALPDGFWTPLWWLAVFVMLTTIDATNALYTIARSRIGVPGVDAAKAHEDLRRLPNMIRPAVAGLAAAIVVQWVR